MEQASQKSIFDSRLLEIEELYRQRKPEIAQERITFLIDSDYDPEGFELGLFNYLLASQYFYNGDYKKAEKKALRASTLLASSVFHTRVGRIHLLLYRVYSELGQYRIAKQFAHDAHAFFRRADDTTGMIGALNGLARISFIQCKFSRSVDYIDKAVTLSKGDNIRMTELIGNLGRVEILSGDWALAEEHLKTALKLAKELDQRTSSARNLLSLGYLKTRLRQFASAEQNFNAAEAIINEDNLFRETLILSEYRGELAYEMGDMIRSGKILREAQNTCRNSIPESALAAQINRRLAMVEMSLDNLDDALGLAQKAFDIAEKIGEKNEIGLTQIVMAQIFSLRNDNATAVKYIKTGVEELRVAGDPFDVARSLIIMADIFIKSKTIGKSAIDKSFDEAYKIFIRLKQWYNAGDCTFKQAIHGCNSGRLSAGFKKLIEAEYLFEKINEKSKIRSIKLFKQELSKQAVAAAVSNENEFKIFGDYFSESEYTGLKTGQIDRILEILQYRTKSTRVVLYKSEMGSDKKIFNLGLDDLETKRFSTRFKDLLGEEISVEYPTLLLDCRRDPFINELVKSSANNTISSVIVVPLIQEKIVEGYLYLDRIIDNGSFIPFGQKELNFTVGFADLISLKLAEFEKHQLEEDNRRLKEQLMEKAAFPNIITQNQPMLNMLSRVKQIVDSNISISIAGETGSGKDLLAKAIHYNSIRRDKRFISVNCAALPESLLESELFGHTKGAFTGADREKVGLFEEADGGTFFLDEIADMPLSIQAKILRILEEKELVRLGDTKPIEVDVRIVSATNKDLKVEMEAGRFRQDLYYRLTALCFLIPPLRERKEDIPLLIDHFAAGMVKFSTGVMRKLVAFDWPGNVRELENEIKKVTLLSGESGTVEIDLLSSKINDLSDETDTTDRTPVTDIDLDGNFSLYDYLAEYEKRFIVKALQENNCVKKHAARSLNIPESTLRLKIKQYNIDLKNLNAA